MSNRRQLILETFEEIPNRIDEAEKCCESCLADESLRHEVVELFVAILIAIMEMMEWLVEKGGCKSPNVAPSVHNIGCSWHEGKQIKALYQGPRYGVSLDEKIKNVEKQSASVERCINGLWRETTARTESKMDKSLGLTYEVQATTMKTQEHSAVSRCGVMRMEANQANMTELVQTMLKSLESLLQEVFRKRDCKCSHFADHIRTIPTRRRH